VSGSPRLNAGEVRAFDADDNLSDATKRLVDRYVTAAAGAAGRCD
jgi:hypothetical protein